MKRISLYLFFLFSSLLFFQKGYAQENLAYDKLFGESYRKAINWAKQNRQQVDSIFKVYQVPSKFLWALVMPEVIRYDAFFDAIETGSLELLYVQMGAYYADFSIGRFQMKPSFAERIEKDANLLLDKSFLKNSGFLSFKNLQDHKEVRNRRVERLENQIWQCNYLAAFYKICEKKFRSLKFQNESEKLRFFATAYNTGYQKPVSEIRKNLNKKFYTLSKIFSATHYNYADIAVFMYGKTD